MPFHLVLKADSPKNQNKVFQNFPDFELICLQFKTVDLTAAASQSAGNYEILYSGEIVIRHFTENRPLV